MNTYYVVEYFDVTIGEWRRSVAIAEKFFTVADARQTTKEEGEEGKWYRIVRVVVQEFESSKPFRP